jgi:branched-chain amino acid transport system ATP-binding protein
MLEVRGVTKRFGGLIAVNAASLTAAQGTITGLIGPNGAGKTTLFAIIAGFLKPDFGSVRFEGEEIVGVPPHRLARRGLVRTFQIVQPFQGLTVRENIAVGCHRRVPSRAAALAEAEAIADRVGMAALLDQPAATLTIAGRKRLELARALATAPKLLLLDEVMAGLNPGEIGELVPVIQRIRAGGVTILMIEHVMQAVMSLAERVHVLSDGRVIAQGAPTDIVADPTVVEAYLGHGAAERLRAKQEIARA